MKPGPLKFELCAATVGSEVDKAIDKKLHPSLGEDLLVSISTPIRGPTSVFAHHRVFSAVIGDLWK